MSTPLGERYSIPQYRSTPSSQSSRATTPASSGYRSSKYASESVYSTSSKTREGSTPTSTSTNLSTACPRPSIREGYRPYIPPHQRRGTVPTISPDKPKSVVSRSYAEGLGEVIISKGLRDIIIPTDTLIRGLVVAGSYKWVKMPNGESGPTIKVPGVPDVWVGSDGYVGQVKRDEDLDGNKEYADYNAHSVPAGYSPLEPVILSLISPTYLRNIHVITGRNNLKKLFAFCLAFGSSPKTAKDLHQHGYRFGVEPFRIDASVLPNSRIVVMNRWEPPSRREAHVPTSFHLSFHERMTISLYPGSDRTSGCHRVIRYSFGGLNVLVKSDVDAALPWEGTEGHDHHAEDTEDTAQLDLDSSSTRTSTEMDEDAMSVDTALWDTITTDTKDTTHIQSSTIRSILSFPTQNVSMDSAPELTSSGIRILRSPTAQPPQGHLISIKTRSTRDGRHLREINKVADVFAGLHFAQVPHLYLARHTAGDFQEGLVDQYELGRGALGIMGKEYEDVLRQVRGVLDWMIRMTRVHGKVGFIGHEGKLVGYELQGDEKQFSEEAKAILRLAGIHHQT